MKKLFALLLGLALLPIPAQAASPITHIIIVIQAGRSADYMFQGLSGFDSQNFGLNSSNNPVTLTQVTLGTTWSLKQTNPQAMTQFNNGAMNGFDQNPPAACFPLSVPNCAYITAMPSEVAPYAAMASTWATADRFFSSQSAPDYPGNQYLIAGASSAVPTSPSAAPNTPYSVSENASLSSGTCANQSTVAIIDPLGVEGDTTPTCLDQPTLGDLLDYSGVTWKFYEDGTHGLPAWWAYDQIYHIYYGPDAANIVRTPGQIVQDIQNGQLANVSWVTPGVNYSDQPGYQNNGPAYVAAIVNALGASSYWSSSTLFVVWNNWGGMYDHVPPPRYNSLEPGFRVPFIAIGPYVLQGYVSHTQHEYASILNYVMTQFGIPCASLGQTDFRADDLNDMFNYSLASPAPFGTPFPAPTWTPD